MAKEARIDNPGHQLARCRTLRELRNLHDRWMPRLDAGKHRSTVERVFPLPPLPDERFIRAIRTAEDLEAESRQMSHCVRSYASAVEAGECFIYRVLRPERGTLEINKLKDGVLALGQFKLAHNRAPALETWEYVRAWFDKYSR